MKLSSRIIAKILTLCGISLTCTACYAAPNTDYIPPQTDGTEEVAPSQDEGTGSTGAGNTADFASGETGEK
jgi:hypothetical protein